MISLLKELFTDDTGATAIEYGLIAALVSVAAIVALQALGTSLTNIFQGIADTLNGAGGGGLLPPPPAS